MTDVVALNQAPGSTFDLSTGYPVPVSPDMGREEARPIRPVASHALVPLGKAVESDAVNKLKPKPAVMETSPPAEERRRRVFPPRRVAAR